MAHEGVCRKGTVFFKNSCSHFVHPSGVPSFVRLATAAIRHGSRHGGSHLYPSGACRLCRFEAPTLDDDDPRVVKPLHTVGRVLLSWRFFSAANFRVLNLSLDQSAIRTRTHHSIIHHG